MASSPTSSTHIKSATAFSCVRCFDRKVKCDRLQPCNACQKHNAECVYRVPPPPRRRKKRAQEEILRDRLRRCEQLLQQQGIDPHEVSSLTSPASRGDRHDPKINQEEHEVTSPPSNAGASSDRQFVSSQLVFDQSRSQYIDNHLWSRVAEEMHSPQEAFLADSDEDEDDSSDVPEEGSPDFVLAPTPSSRRSRASHPPADHVFSLWHIFLENFNPLNMVIHRPTLHVSIQQAVSNLANVPKPLEALMFAIYSAAIYSMREQDCEYQFGEQKQILLSRFQRATKTALSRARFLSTKDIVVLQAFIVHLISSRDAYDPRTLWILTGSAVRIAESMGLHKDGTVLGLPPFESEIRRRMWWQVIMLDTQSAELAGSSKFGYVFRSPEMPDIPLNLNDEDIYPGMTELPKPRVTSESMFCCLRYTFASFWYRKMRQQMTQTSHDASIWGNYKSVDDIAEKDKNINEVQKMAEENFIKHCDQSDPLQLVTSLVGSSATLAMRLVVHHPRRYPRDQDVPASEQELIWSLSTRLLEADNNIHANRKLSGFLWHSRFYFQWQALLYVLDVLRANPLKSDASKAWQLVHESYEHHPTFIKDIKRPIHVAVGTLCLKAYSARENALASKDMAVPLRPPEYITALRQQRAALPTKKRSTGTVWSSAPSLTDTSATGDSMQPYDLSQMAQVPPLQQPPQQSQPTIPYQQIFTQQSMDTNVAWYDDFGLQPVGKNTDAVGFNAGITNAPVNTDMSTEYFMDWNQWDMLLQNHSMEE